jgi:hypothetical protein
MCGKHEILYIGTETITKSLRGWELVLFNLQHSRQIKILLIFILLCSIKHSLYVCGLVCLHECLSLFVFLGIFFFICVGLTVVLVGVCSENGVCIVCIHLDSENRVRVNLDL